MALASPSLWKTTIGSPLTPSSSSCRTSLIFSFSLDGTRTRRRRDYGINLSLDRNSCSENVPRTGTGKELLKKKAMIQVGGGSSMDSGNDELHLPTTNEKNNHKNESISIRLYSFFGKRPLWRRILFASKKVRSILLLNVITLIYASNIPVVKEIEAIMDPSAFTVVRFTLSAVPFIPFILKARGDVQTRNSGIELGIWVSLGYLMQALGLLTSDAGRASFFTSFTVVVVPLLDGIFGAKVPTRTWIGAFVSLLGVSLLESSGSPPCIGDLLNILSAVFFGVHMLRTEHISRNTKKSNFLALLGYEVLVVAILSSVWYFIGGRYGGMHGWDPGSWTWTMVWNWIVEFPWIPALYTGIFSTGLCLWVEGVDALYVHVYSMVWNWIVEFPWIPALYTGIFSTGLCLWVEIAAMRDVSATETAIVYGLEPLWGAGFAWFLLGERWGTAGWIGAALILGGSLTVQIFGASSPTEEENSDQGGLLVSDKRKGFSPSAVVSTRKNVQDFFGKK